MQPELQAPEETVIKVTFVGSNPSEASPDDSPFHAQTRSRLILDAWIKGANAEYALVNVIDQKTRNNRPLTIAQIKDALPGLRAKIKTTKVVALGKTAEKALTLMGIGFITMPHPSGLNRKLNDPKYVEQEVAKLHAYLTSDDPYAPSALQVQP